MLACARRRVQSALLRPFAFSTVPPRQDAQNPALDSMKDLSNILNKQGDVVSPIIPETTSQSEQSV